MMIRECGFRFLIDCDNLGILEILGECRARLDAKNGEVRVA
jgi:hypothetical protein